jgi:hypothetical protein
MTTLVDPGELFPVSYQGSLVQLSDSFTHILDYIERANLKVFKQILKTQHHHSSHWLALFYAHGCVFVQNVVQNDTQLTLK